MRCWCGQPLVRGFGCVAHGEPREAPTVAPIVKAAPHKRWTAAERAFAIANMRTMTSLQIGAALGKTEKSVKHFYERQRISKPRPRHQRATRRERPTSDTRHYQRWTEEEMVQLECGEFSGLVRSRGKAAVWWKASQLGLIIANDGCLSVRQAAREYSLTHPRVLRLVHAGILPAHRSGTRPWRIDPADAERVLSPLVTRIPPPGTRPPAPTPPSPLRAMANYRRVVAMRAASEQEAG